MIQRISTLSAFFNLVLFITFRFSFVPPLRAMSMPSVQIFDAKILRHAVIMWAILVGGIVLPWIEGNSERLDWVNADDVQSLVGLSHASIQYRNTSVQKSRNHCLGQSWQPAQHLQDGFVLIELKPLGP